MHFQNKFSSNTCQHIHANPRAGGAPLFFLLGIPPIACAGPHDNLKTLLTPPQPAQALNDYIDGANQDGTKVDHTVPIVMKVHVSDPEAGTVENQFEVGYFLPYDLQVSTRCGWVGVSCGPDRCEFSSLLLMYHAC